MRVVFLTHNYPRYTGDLSDPAEFQRFQDAQNQLTQALGQLRTIVENYPQLQSNQNFLALQNELEKAFLGGASAADTTAALAAAVQKAGK